MSTASIEFRAPFRSDRHDNPVSLPTPGQSDNPSSGSQLHGLKLNGRRRERENASDDPREQRLFTEHSRSIQIAEEWSRVCLGGGNLITSVRYLPGPACAAAAAGPFFSLSLSLRLESVGHPPTSARALTASFTSRRADLLHIWRVWAVRLRQRAREGGRGRGAYEVYARTFYRFFTHLFVSCG